MDPFSYKANLEQQAGEEFVNLIERFQLMPRLLRMLHSLFPMRNRSRSAQATTPVHPKLVPDWNTNQRDA